MSLPAAQEQIAGAHTKVHRCKCDCGDPIELDTDGNGNVVELDLDGYLHRCGRATLGELPVPAPRPELPLRRLELTPELREIIARLYREGLTYDEIRAETGAGFGTIARVRDEVGLAKRRPA